MVDPSWSESVAGAAHGPQHIAPDLASQVTDIDLDRVGVYVICRVPDVVPNAVEVYVGYLRRKVGRDVLLTVRGAGYRLAP